MLKLIMADIKVLGHRLWAIPVGVFLFIMMFSFIPYFGEVYNIYNFILAVLIPGLLIFELFREEQKNNTSCIYLTMPVSKEKYVFGKYIIVFLFLIISFVLNCFLAQLLSVIHGNEYLVKDINDYALSLISGTANIGKTLLIIIPIYYYTRKLKLSLILGFVLNSFVIYGYRSISRSMFFDIDTLNGRGLNLLILTFVLVIIFSLIHLIIKYKLKNVNKDKNAILNLWFPVTLFFTFISLDKIKSFSMHYFHYQNYKSGYLEKFAELSVKNKLLTQELLNSYVNNFIIISMYFIICITALLVIYRKSNDKFFINSVLFILLPVFISLITRYFDGLIYYNWNDFNFNLLPMQGKILDTIVMLPGLLIMIYFSAKSSIYLLKNNRTLK